MEKEAFFNKLKEQSEQIKVQLNKEQLEKFYSYMNLLIEWNEKINLTAIIEPEEIIQKHFVDSLTISKYVGNQDSIIDVGTGAGFPGIPLKITKESTNIVLLDALNKRLNFLNEVIKKNERRWWIVKTTRKAVALVIVTAWDITNAMNVSGESRKKRESNEVKTCLQSNGHPEHEHPVARLYGRLGGFIGQTG